MSRSVRWLRRSILVVELQLPPKNRLWSPLAAVRARGVVGAAGCGLPASGRIFGPGVDFERDARHSSCRPVCPPPLRSDCVLLGCGLRLRTCPTSPQPAARTIGRVRKAAEHSCCPPRGVSAPKNKEAVFGRLCFSCSPTKRLQPRGRKTRRPYSADYVFRVPRPSVPHNQLDEDTSRLRDEGVWSGCCSSAARHPPRRL